MASSPHILIVDDEIEIVKLIAEVLGDEGYTVERAYDGPGALRAVQASEPALVLLDYLMPGMTGPDVLAQLRQLGFSKFPVVLMSAGTRADLARQAGADLFLAKPFDLNTLLDAVKQLLVPQKAA